MPTEGAFSDTWRGRRDYWIYLLRQQPWWKAALLLMVLAAAVYKLAGVSDQDGLVTLAIGGGLAALGCLEAIEQLRHFQLVGHGARLERVSTIQVDLHKQILLHDLLPSARQAQMGFVVAGSHGDSVMSSEAVDNSLRTADWPLVQDQGKAAKVAESVRGNRSHVLACLGAVRRDALKRRALLVNEKKLCLDDELAVNAIRLHYHIGSYFTSICTNEASTMMLIGEGRRSLPDGERALYPVALDARGYFLEDLNEAAVENHIGVSTLAITRDGYLVLWQQTPKNVQSPGTVVCTGSGSCDAADLITSSLRSTIIRAMERELLEECRGRLGPTSTWSNAIIAQTHIIGFFRWLQRGGKPEFIGISRLKISASELTPDGFETAGITGRSTNGQLIKLKSKFEVSSIDDVPSVLADIRQLFGKNEETSQVPMSLPLVQILRVIDRMHTDNPAVLAEFLFGPGPMTGQTAQK